MPPIASTPVIGSPSSQWACNGQARTTRVKHSTPRSAFNGASPLAEKIVTDQVSLSPSMVASDIVPIGTSGGPSRAGSDGPVKYRE